MEEKVISKMEESIEKILDEGLNTNNLDTLVKLSKVKHYAKEDKSMNGNYNGRGPSYDNYGHDNYGGYNGYNNYNNYMARGRDMRYRGDDEIERMSTEYGRYMESRNRYGASEETDKSFHYMVKALEDFIKVLDEEADTPQQKQQLRQALQNAMR